MPDWNREMTGEATYHSVSVAGVVIDENGRTLVIQRRDNGHWEPPGVLERDESIIEGLLREVREETGLIVEPVALTGVYKNMRLGVVALVFRCRQAGGALTENSEAAGFRWIRESQVSAIMPEAFAIRILDAYRNDAGPSIRDHDGAKLITLAG